MKQTYCEHTITASAVLLIDTNEWQPHVVIAWKEADDQEQIVSRDIDRSVRGRRPSGRRSDSLDSGSTTVGRRAEAVA
jgi:hypothetical protein